ncbi:MAG: head-tail connector protein [Devosia sp.]
MTSYLIAGPGEEPVSLAETKLFCRIDGADEDALVSALIAAARLHVESLTGRALIAQTWRLVLDSSPLLVPLPVVPAIALVDAPDGAVLQGDSVLLAEQVDQLTLDYTAGYGGAEDVPQDLKQAVLTLVAYWYEHRDSVTEAPLGFERLVSSYRRVRL